MTKRTWKSQHQPGFSHTSWMKAGSGKSRRKCQLFENSLKTYTRQMDKSHHIFAYYFAYYAYYFSYCCIFFDILCIFCILQYAEYAEYEHATIILHITLHILHIISHIVAYLFTYFAYSAYCNMQNMQNMSMPLLFCILFCIYMSENMQVPKPICRIVACSYSAYW